jgi:hypothetical protein
MTPMLKYFKKIRTSNYVITAILCSVCLTNLMFSTATNGSVPFSDSTGYAGSRTCAACHKDIYDSHIQTAHYLDSRPASGETIKGKFSAGSNRFVYNKWMEVVMEQKGDRYFQTAYLNGNELQSEPFELVIGSGRKGQSYLYWNENALFQLPVSYYTPLNSWCNSPGYSNHTINFGRMIPAQCIECHGTYASVQPDADGVPIIRPQGIIYGIDCERCHGPGAGHVTYHREHPDDSSSKHIISARTLNRQQRLDACALCHSGFRKEIKPAFSFMAGDKLDEFSTPGFSNDSTSTLDVHGNQYGLLLASKCFQMSAMDCSSCHNVHVNEFMQTRVFSQRCMSCHADTRHRSFEGSLAKISTLGKNCIDCHMPMLPSKAIVLDVANTTDAVPDLVRTHRIAIYPAKTKEVLDGLKQQR